MIASRRNFLIAGAAGLAAPALLRATPVTAKTPAAGMLTPTFHRRKLGSFEVIALLDGTLDGPPQMITGYNEETAVATLSRQHLPPAPNGLPIPVLGYVIDTGSQLIAVDCGTFDGFAPRLGGYHAALTAAGIDAADIDTVLITHLHPDHIGGLIDPQGNRLFPNAQLHIGATEWNFWHAEGTREAFPEDSRAFVDIARNYPAPYDGRIVTFNDNAEILPGVLSVPLPGHTPGHSGFRFHSDGQDLLIWGDVVHQTFLQFDNPAWTIAFDMDAEQTRKTRLKMFDMAAADGFQVAGSHIDFPGVGYVEKTSGGYRYSPAPFDYML